MGQIVTINGRPIECEREPYLTVGQPVPWQTPVEINGKMVYGVNINGYDYPPAEAGCVLYLPGLPGQGLNAWNRCSTGGTNDGTVFGALWRRLPSGLWYQDYDGVDDYTNCGNDASFDIVTAITLEAWIRPEATNDNYARIINKTSGATHVPPYVRYNLAYQGTGDKTPRCDVSVGGVDVVLIAGSAIPDLFWTHLLMTYNGTTQAIYLDGTLSNSQLQAGAIDTSTRSVFIGKNEHTTEDFNGGIALVRIYNRALDALEVMNHFQREKWLFGR